MANNTANYTCPMHPEVTSDKPGRCPKCGMALIAKTADQKTAVQRDLEAKGLAKITWQSYVPLITIVTLIVLATVAAAWGRPVSLSDLTIYFMTGFFLVFSGFKIMDLKGFAEGYSTYDLLAQKWFGYGYVYPFIELSFGLIMLAGYHPDWLLWTEFGVMAFSGLGVAIKLAKREPFMCACLGTFLKVPLTYVTLVEDFGMAALALLLVIFA